MKRNRAPNERPLHAVLIAASLFCVGLNLLGSPTARATQACITDGPCADVTTPEERRAHNSQGEDAEHGPGGFQSTEASGEADDEEGAEQSHPGAESEGAADGHDGAESEGASDDDSPEAGESEEGDASQTGNGSPGAG
jgi:hypothetical protein